MTSGYQRELVDEATDARKFAHNPTRFLAGAAYTDKKFRDSVILMDEAPFRAKAPELGIDYGFVLSHCRRARSRKLNRDLVLVLVFAIFIIAFLLSRPFDYYDQSEYFAGNWSIFVATWITSVIIVFYEAYLDQVVALMQDLGRAPVGLSDAGTSVAETNVVVYGSFSPFVGCGIDLGGWSFAVNLEAAGEDSGTPKTFEITELYDALTWGFHELEIEGLDVRDCVFVDGRAIRGDTRFLPNEFAPPVNKLNADEIHHCRLKSGKTARHYLWVSVSDWGGDLYLSNFIRLQVNGNRLFFEINNFLLPPIKGEYCDLNKFSDAHRAGKTFEIACSALVAAPFLLVLSPFLVWGAVSRWSSKDQAKRREKEKIEKDLHYNYGALGSVREFGASGSWNLYFQKLDHEMHRKTIQQQTLDILTKFLEEKGIDTSEIKDRRSYILNQGVIVSGGVVTAESIAVGKGAQASSSPKAA